MFVVNNFIDGKFEPTQEYLDNVDPATGQVSLEIAYHWEIKVSMVR